MNLIVLRKSDWGSGLMATRYYIEEETLGEWCFRKHYPYQNATKYIRKHPNYTKEELENYLKSVESRRRIFIGKQSLRDFCKEHECDYQMLYLRLKNENDPDRINQIAYDFIKENPIGKGSNYCIEGTSLRKYCEEHDYVYSTVKTYIQNIRKEEPEMTKDEAAQVAISYYKENHISKERYFFHGERLTDYCKRKNYKYKNIMGYLARYVVDSYHITDLEMAKAVEKYHIKVRKDMFLSLNEKENLEDCTEILDVLKISLDSVKLVMRFEISFKQAILFVWYFGVEENGSIVINTEKIKAVYQNLDHLESLEVNELIGYYKTGLYDTRTMIYQRMFLPTRKIIADLCKYHNIWDKHRIEDLEAQTDQFLLDMIEKTTSRYLGQIISYMNAYIKGCLKKYVLGELQEQNSSLNEPAFRDDKKQERIDRISSGNSIDTEYMSEDLYKILNSLTQTERRFILLKYQKQYTYEEISKIFGCSQSEIESIDEKILNQLSKREDVKLLIK